MRRTAQRGTVALGLLGTGALWDRRYRAAVQRLSTRLSIRAVYDPVFGRAQHVAAEFQAEPVSGMRQLFERADVQGLLILDSAWYGLLPAELACQTKKPAFLAGTLGEDLPALSRLHRQASDQGVLLMTEFSRRHTPATNRLRELLVTKLGQVRHVSISGQRPLALTGDTVADAHTSLLVGLFDWCGYVTGRVPVSLTTLPLAASAENTGGCRIEIGFRPDVQGLPQTTAAIELQDSANCESLEAFVHQVECERGRAQFSDPAQIEWQNGACSDCESLTTERTDAEVMLDQFCRRILGGLVPVADVQDACRGLQLALAARAAWSGAGGSSEA